MCKNVFCGSVLTLLDFQKLEDLNIQITWELPKLHQIDNGSQHTTFKSLKEMLKAEKVYVDKNKFTKEEENIIVKNWQCFSKVFRINL